MAVVGVEDRVQGVLVGLAVGDRNGGPVQMALRTARSLLELGRFDVDDVAGRYLAWWRDGAFDTGPTTAAVLELVAGGMSWADAATSVDRAAGGLTAGCNPAHRSVPLAMFHGLPEGQLVSAARLEAALTHTDRLAGDVAVAANLLCRSLIPGSSWPDAVREATVGRQDETVRSLEATGPPNNRGGFAPAVLAASVWFVGTSAEFGEALDRSLKFAGPANYCPVLVGAIAGARWGAGVIERPVGGQRKTYDEAREVAEQLSLAWR